MEEESKLSVKLPLPEVKSVPNIVSPDSERAELVFEEHLIEYVRAEKEHLSKFVKDCRKLFDHILNQKSKFHHHLCEFFHRIQSRRLLFETRVVHLQSISEYLELEEVIIAEYFEMLESYLEILEALSEDEHKTKELGIPNMQVVQHTAHDLLDRLFGLQSRLIETLIIPLDCLEREFQRCIFKDLAGFICWQQETKYCRQMQRGF